MLATISRNSGVLTRLHRRSLTLRLTHDDLGINLVNRAVRVGHLYGDILHTRGRGIRSLNILELGALRQVVRVLDVVLRIRLAVEIDFLRLRLWLDLVCLRDNQDGGSGFLAGAIRVGHNHDDRLITGARGIRGLLELELGTLRQVIDVLDGIVCLRSGVQRHLTTLTARVIFISLVRHGDSCRNLIGGAIWVSHNDGDILLPRLRSIRLLALLVRELGAVRQAIRILDVVLRIRGFALLNLLVLALRIVVVRVRSYLDGGVHGLGGAVRVSHNDGDVLCARGGGIRGLLVLELSALRQLINVADAVLGLRLGVQRHFLFFALRGVVVRIRLIWVGDLHRCIYGVLGAVRVGHDHLHGLITRGGSVRGLLVLELGALRQLVRVLNVVLRIRGLTFLDRLVLAFRRVLLGVVNIRDLEVRRADRLRAVLQGGAHRDVELGTRLSILREGYSDLTGFLIKVDGVALRNLEGIRNLVRLHRRRQIAALLIFLFIGRGVVESRLTRLQRLTRSTLSLLIDRCPADQHRERVRGNSAASYVVFIDVNRVEVCPERRGLVDAVREQLLKAGVQRVRRQFAIRACLHRLAGRDYLASIGVDPLDDVVEVVGKLRRHTLGVRLCDISRLRPVFSSVVRGHIERDVICVQRDKRGVQVLAHLDHVPAVVSVVGPHIQVTVGLPRGLHAEARNILGGDKQPVPVDVLGHFVAGVTQRTLTEGAVVRIRRDSAK